ncbi:Atu4866 domain-containing protein [Streptomyces bluensis]
MDQGVRHDREHGRRCCRRGRHVVTGSRIDDVDDSGFTATGDIRDGVLHHEHLVLYREEQQT